MSETTLTHEYLIAIYKAMAKIELNDRSTYFNRYFIEVQDRLEEIRFINNLNKLNDGNK